MKKSIYLIGNIPDGTVHDAKYRYRYAQKKLERLNFQVHNPFDTHIDCNMSEEEKRSINYHLLLRSNAIYVMSDTILNHENRFYIALAIKLNLTVMHEAF